MKKLPEAVTSHQKDQMAEGHCLCMGVRNSLPSKREQFVTARAGGYLIGQLRLCASRHRGRLCKGEMGKRLLPNYVFTCILGVAGSRQYKAYICLFFYRKKVLLYTFDRRIALNPRSVCFKTLHFGLGPNSGEKCN